ncbi:hypothetical protein [uncultured Psychrosphaera sp.]|uniref:hypothetical protein n=1 Tax=uncultured Psychrosphaera sp. TaxID=1403522 RepID=UPI002633E25C|nr:hypothetical protein [uncultured Psychrosphaera sp.]
MKNSKHSVFAASLILSTVLATSLVSGNALAEKNKNDKEKPVREMVKVKAVEGKDIKVFVASSGEKNKYTFSAEELKSMDNVTAKLGDLDKETSDKIVTLLSKLEDYDTKVVVLNDTDITRGDKTSSVFMLKTDDKNGTKHIEIDVVGDAKFNDKHLVKMLLADGKKMHKGKHKGKHEGKMKGHMRDKDTVKVLTKIINKSELTAEQVEELTELLASKK